MPLAHSFLRCTSLTSCRVASDCNCCAAAQLVACTNRCSQISAADARSVSLGTTPASLAAAAAVASASSVASSSATRKAAAAPQYLPRRGGAVEPPPASISFSSSSTPLPQPLMV